MVRRIAARVVTGPVAFFVAGVIDVTVFSIAAWRDRRRSSRGRRA